MIAAFLLPYPFRGYRAPYLWLFYRLLASFDEPVLFLAGRDYLRSPDSWAGQGRWEMQAHSGQRLGYRIPAEAEFERHRYRFLADDLFEDLLAECAGNPVAAFKHVLSERIPRLEAAFSEALADADGIEAILTWCNCPSLGAVAGAKGIPLLHLEMGPLRWPLYRPTAYLDFRGVNGNTEAEARCREAGSEAAPGISVERLRDFFYLGARTPPTPRFDAGVALQVEDDSNLVAFGHDYDNQALLVHAHLAYPDRDVLVRGHPGSLFALKPDWYRVDDSPDSVAFINQCRRLLTINSSVGLEALLMAVPVDVLGDCSYRFITEAAGRDESLAWLALYLFAYLVPMDLIYDPAYLRFRLARPSEFDIVARHLAAYGLAVSQASARAGGSPMKLIETALHDAGR